MSITRLSYCTVQEGDVIGIEFAANTSLYGRDPYIESLGEFKVVNIKQCLCLEEIKSNWFHKVYGIKAIMDFGPNMFILLRRS